MPGNDFAQRYYGIMAPANDFTSRYQGITANIPVSQPAPGGISYVGWIAAAVAVALMYQWKPARPYVAGLVVLVVLAMLLKNEPTISSQFATIFTNPTKG